MNQRPSVARCVGGKGDAIDYCVTPHAKRDAAANECVGSGQHAAVAVEVKRALREAVRSAFIACEAELIGAAAPAIAADQQFAVGLQRGRPAEILPQLTDDVGHRREHLPGAVP